MEIELVLADYRCDSHRQDIEHLMDCYAQDPMGGGKPLAQHVRNALVNELAKLDYAFSIICYANGSPAGLANCFMGFSTFKCQPLINIHDFIVAKEFRRRQIGERMLSKIAELGKEKGCCKITLEVLEGNEAARKAYRKAGFQGYELDPKMGNALFWEKQL